jgi:hypothetical protein
VNSSSANTALSTESQQQQTAITSYDAPHHIGPPATW